MRRPRAAAIAPGLRRESAGKREGSWQQAGVPGVPRARLQREGRRELRVSRSLLHATGVFLFVLPFFVIRICCLCTAHGTTTKRSREALSPTFCRRVVLTPRFCFADPWRPCIVFGAGSLIFKLFFDFSVAYPILDPGMAP